ncbi:MAG: choice-of-anchor D domain-containing protein [Spirochaetota bacterium]
MKIKILNIVTLFFVISSVFSFLSCWDTTQTIDQDDRKPQINVRASTLEIPSSGTYDFGQIEVDQTKTAVITIENFGQKYLELSPITISGPDAALFSIVNQPNTTVPPFTYTTFTVSFTPDSQGIKTATITIPNNDPQKTTFTFTLQGEGIVVTAPEINVQYSVTTINNNGTVSLGSCVVGNSADFTVTIQNIGTDDLTVQLPVLLSGIDSSLFTIETNPATTVAPGTSTPFVIQFSPTSAGIKTAVVTINNNDADEGTFTFTITATATTVPQPDIFITQDVTPLYNGTGLFNFGNVNQGETSALVTFTIKNTGTANLTLTTPFTISGADATMFSISPPGSTDIAPNNSTTFEMTFTPTSSGEKTATVEISNNVPGKSTYTFTVKGTGIAIPEIDVFQGVNPISNNGAFDIGSTTINVSKDTVFTITNNGAGILYLTANPVVALTGSPFFSIFSNPGTPINPSSSSNFTLRYLPTEAGTHTTILTIANNDLDENPYTITITGQATTVPTPKIEVSKSSQVLLNNSTVDVGGMTVGGNPIDVTFTITNKGDSNLSITGVTISPGDFTIITPPSTPVAPGASTTVVIRFSASSAGDKTADLTIESDDPNNNTFTINLSGKGLNPEINCKINGVDFASGSTYDFGNLAIGHTKDVIVTIENLSATDPLYLTGNPVVQMVSGAEFIVASQPSKISIPPSGSTTFTLRFAPTSTGNKVAQFQIQNSDSNENPYIINVQGQATNAAIQIDEVANGGSVNFGNVKCNTGGVTRTFTIRNNGSTDLVLQSTPPVIISGPNKNLFTVETSPATTISPSSTTQFTVRFNPQVLADTGDKTATVVIQSNDPNIPLYTFTVTGKGTTPHISVSDGVNPILKGGTFTFPDVNYGSAGVTQTFTITNTGDADLLLTGTPKVTISGTGASHFSVITQPTSPVAASGTTTFQIRFNPTSLGTHTATVTIVNDTIDGNNPFTFTIEGLCNDTEAPVITITGPTANSYTNGTQSLTFTYSDNVGVTSVQAKIGSGSLNNISSPAVINTINGWASAAEGLIEIYLEAKDAANNTGTATLNLIKDTIAPVITITAPAPNSYTNGTQLLTFTTSDAGVVTSVQAKIGTGTFTNISSTAAINTINGWASASEGTITINMQATDAAGNTGTTSLSLIKDITPPSITIDAPGAGSIINGNESLQFTVTDLAVAVTRVKIDSGTFSNVNSPVTINTLNGWSPPYTGTNITVYIEADDEAGNTGTANRTFFADTVAPTGNITSPTNGATVSGMVLILADADDSGGSGIDFVEFYIGGALVATDSSSPWSYNWDTTGYLNGPYALKIRVVDIAGNEYIDDDTTVTVNN